MADSDDDREALRQKMLSAQSHFAQYLKHDSTDVTVAATAPELRENSFTAADNVLQPSVPKGDGTGDAASQIFDKLKTAYAKKQAAGSVTLVEEIAYLRAEAEENARRDKIVADRDFDCRPTPAREIDGSDAEEDDTSMFVHQRYDVFSDVEDECPAPSKKSRKRKTNDGTTAARKRGQTQKKAKLVNMEDAASTKKKAKDRRPAQSLPMVNVNNLMGANVFSDVAAQEDLPSQPIFHATNKEEARKQLVASIPDKKTQSEARWLIRATQDFTGNGVVVPAENGLWRVKGLRTTLKHYQVIGGAFMRRREKDGQQPRGGILADEMGLGKTIISLANIINGLPERTSHKPRATLVVASPALVSQWSQEIIDHVETTDTNKRYGIGTVLEYHARSRLKATDIVKVLEQADIVLTTYHEVSRSYPKAILPPELSTPESMNSWFDAFYETNKGVLHRCKFHRIVLDEAHAIKNHRSHTSLACRALTAKYRWAVTGTPIQNNIGEFYPYFKFLQDPIASNMRLWKQNFITGTDPTGTQRLGVLLSKVMLRRTHIDTMFDSKLLNLPTPHQSTVLLEFNRVERQVYQIIKNRFVSHINHLSSQGQLDKQYRHVFTMLIRLRQICSHILLVQESLMDLLEREDFEKLSRITESEDELHGESGEMLGHLRRMLAVSVQARSADTHHFNPTLVAIETESVPIDLTTTDVDMSPDEVGGQHGLRYPIGKYLDAVRNSGRFHELTSRSPCCGCGELPQNPYVTSCDHIYCLKCLTELGCLAARRGHDCARCTQCGEHYLSSKPCAESDVPNLQHDTSRPATGSLKKTKKLDASKDWLNLKGEVLPSTKTLAVKSQILNWFNEDEPCKCIIFSQFQPMLDIMDWGYRSYTGKLSHDARGKSIKEFRDEPNIKILLCGFKAGGIGLNLTMANKVINLDPWWNISAEQQAFCRVFRIGQEKTACMTRFVMRNSIDEDMIQLQEQKQLNIDTLMDGSKKFLSIEELMRLFGEVGEDPTGRPFIFPEKTESDDQHRRPDFDHDDEEYLGGRGG